jgi:hypothetical protein
MISMRQDEKLVGRIRRSRNPPICNSGGTSWRSSKQSYGLREFDTQDTTFVFQGERFPIAPVEAAVRSLIGKIEGLPPLKLA